jgi:hypothetical protein
MSFEDFAPAKIDDRLNVVHGSDNDAFVTFFNKPELVQGKSDQNGHPVYEDMLFVKVEYPGNKLTKFEQPATEDHMQRWPNAYRRFKDQSNDVVIGWRLEEWPVMSRSDVENYKQYRIFTVEQLSAIMDIDLVNVPIGTRSLRDKAIAALQQAQDGSALTRLSAENQSLRVELDMLKQQFSGISLQQPSAIDIKALVAEALAEQLGSKKKAA